MKKKRDLFISAVIVAAGQSTRMNMEINKQYVDICGKPVLARTIQVFEGCALIDEIILVVNGQDIVYCKQNILDEYSFCKVKTLVSGGKSRQESVFNGLNEVDEKCGIVLIHDGARPFVNEIRIAESINAAIEYGAACVAVPVKDTVKRADNQGFIEETPNRSVLWSVQTPQVFKCDIILKAHENALRDGFTATDDAMLVERMGLPVKLVMGEYGNIKITTCEDLAIAETMVNLSGNS